MAITKKIIGLSMFLVVGATIVSYVAINAACDGGTPKAFCKKERSDDRCNSNQDCCSGQRCSVFGLCEPCR